MEGDSCIDEFSVGTRDVRKANCRLRTATVGPRAAAQSSHGHLPFAAATAAFLHRCGNGAPAGDPYRRGSVSLALAVHPRRAAANAGVVPPGDRNQGAALSLTAGPGCG